MGSVCFSNSLNCLLTPVVEKKLSPFEVFYRRKLDYKFLKVFGCACFSYLQRYSKHKLAFKTSKCLFLGYSPFHKGYRCLHPVGHIYVAKSVIFYENSFPYKSLFISNNSLPASFSTKNSGAPAFVLPPLSSKTVMVHSSKCSSVISNPPSALFPNQQINQTLPGQHLNNSSASSSSCQHFNCSSPSFSKQNSDVPLVQVPFISSSPTESSPSSVSSVSTHSKQKQPVVPFLLPFTHPMQTRSKSGIFKPKLLTVTACPEPANVSLALTDPNWKKAINDEYQALIRNHTWDLVPNSNATLVVQCKWVFRTKLKVDGSLDKYKARLVAKGFQQTPGVDFSKTFSPVQCFFKW